MSQQISERAPQNRPAVLAAAFHCWNCCRETDSQFDSLRCMTATLCQKTVDDPHSRHSTPALIVKCSLLVRHQRRNLWYPNCLFAEGGNIEVFLRGGVTTRSHIVTLSTFIPCENATFPKKSGLVTRLGIHTDTKL